MRADIEAKIAQAMDAAQQQARDILERMGLEPEAMLQQAQQDMLAAQPVDLPATLARLGFTRAAANADAGAIVCGCRAGARCRG